MSVPLSSVRPLFTAPCLIVRFVTAIHIPTFSPSSLISGGGDPALKIWDWQHGTVVCEIPVLEAIKPFIRVRAKKRKWGDDDDEEGGGGEKSKKSHGRKGRGKNKQNQKAEAESQNAGEMEVDAAKDETNDMAEPVVVEEEQETAAASTSTITENPAEDPDPVFVLHKIATLDLESDKLILFSAVGSVFLLNISCSFRSCLKQCNSIVLVHLPVHFVAPRATNHPCPQF